MMLMGRVDGRRGALEHAGARKNCADAGRNGRNVYGLFWSPPALRPFSGLMSVALAALFLFLLVPAASVTKAASPSTTPATAKLAAWQEAPIEQRTKARLKRLIQLAQGKRKSGCPVGTRNCGSPPATEKRAAPKINAAPPPARRASPPPARRASPPPARRASPPPPRRASPPPARRASPPPVRKASPPPVRRAPPPPVRRDTVPPPAPKQEKAPPAQETAPQTGPSDEQLGENKVFCANNPDSPKCGGQDTTPQPGQAQQEQENAAFCKANPTSPKCAGGEQPPPQEQTPPPPTEKICTANPNYPGCDKFTEQPDLTPPPDGGGRVPGICEQNPQLPQCQPDNAGPPQTGPPGNTGDQGPPDFPPPPGGGSPIPPAPPPPPPPSGETEPAGPQIQTVTECPDGQFLSNGVCLPNECPQGQILINGICGAEFCPQGTYRTPDLTCVAQCPEGTSIYQGLYVDGCVAECPTSMLPDADNICQPCNGIIHEGQCLSQCPEGMFRLIENNQAQCLAQCPEGYLIEFNRCEQQCTTGYNYIHDGQCLTSCPQATIPHDGQCLSECPTGTYLVEGQCYSECPDGWEQFAGQCVPARDCPSGQVHIQTGEPGGQCIDSCPDTMVERLGSCIGPVVCYQEGGNSYNGQCLESCPDDAVMLNGACMEQCPSNLAAVDGQCSECSEGQYALDGVCRLFCESGQIEVDGACRPLEEADYEVIIAACVEMMQTGGAQVPPELAGETSEQTCQNMIDSQCAGEGGVQGTPASEVPYCLQRPCPDGQENVNGQCPPGAVNDETPPPPDTGTPPADDQQPPPDTCPEGSAEWNGQCVPFTSCAVGEASHQGQCVEYCPNGWLKRIVDGVCVEDDACRQQGGAVVLDACVEPCAEGEMRYGVNNCVTQCPDAAVEWNGQCVVQGSCADGEGSYQGQCVETCPTYMVERAGACINISVCTEQGGVVSSDQHCLEQCPEGQQQYGSRCDISCPQGQYPQNGVCEADCSAGYAYVDGQCVFDPEQPEQPEQGYDDFFEDCVGQVSGDNAGTIPEQYAGMSPQDLCEAFIGDNCDAGGASLICRERPCGDGLENINGQCVAPCGSGLERGEDGQCVAPPLPDTEDQQPPVDGEQPPEGEQPPADDQQPPDTETPPADDQPPPAEDEQPPDDTQQPPEDEQPPPGGTPPPAEGEQRPPADDERPPDSGMPPPPDIGTPPPDAGTPPPGTGMPPTPPVPGTAKEKAPADTIADYKQRTAVQNPLAVVIASARYSSKVIPDSKHAIGGAAAFEKFLEEDVNLPASRIIPLRNGRLADFVELFGEQGGPAGRLQAALASAPASEVIIYFSGRAQPVDDGQDVVLLPSDANAEKLPETGYRLSDVYRILATLGVERLRLYLDTALSEPMDAQPTRDAPASDPVQTRPMIGPLGLFTPPGWVVITAGTGTQPTFANPNRLRSAFTGILIPGLRGLADTTGVGNRDGAVIAGELVAFIRNQVDIAVQTATGGTQRPDFFGRGTEILFAGSIEPAALAAIPADAPQQSGAVEPSFDCAKALAKAEKAICANPAIATLDNVMVGFYNKVRGARQGAALSTLVTQQKQWLKQRNSCGSDVACLAQRYGERIQKLQ